MAQTNQRSLSHYPMEQICVCKDNMKLLLLLNIKDDELLFGGKGRAINAEQDLEQTTISGRKLYPLKCTLTKGSHHLLMDGTKANSYTESRFIQDWKDNNGGVRVKFNGTNISHHFTWKFIINNPNTSMFFRAPLAQS